jgi:hypothetical protein
MGTTQRVCYYFGGFLMSNHRVHRTCVYCDCVYSVSRSAPGDHFPVPMRHGGIDTVDCCRECHSLKDRINLDNWSTAMLSKVAADFPKLSRETRIFLAKAITLFQDAKALTEAQ